MVAFSSFQYKFATSDRELWTRLLNKGFSARSASVTLQINDTDDISRKITFGANSNFENFLNEYPTVQNVTVFFDQIWDQTLFWNCLPTIDQWSEQPEPQSSLDLCQKAVSGISFNGNDNGCYEVGIQQNIDIPFEYIKWIMVQVHKRTPVECLYYSPNKQVIHVMFVAGSRWIITPNLISNHVGLVFDYDDGFLPDVFGFRTCTDEMVADFNTWKTDKSKEVFQLH